ncbi:MAG: hypothetical protein M1546_11245 [Chloroflexi bacterium]|nr:hypothetical protein [Chloroflexota bacterium]
MNIETRQTLYVGINFFFSPMAIIDKHTYLNFQRALSECGIDFGRSEFTEREIGIYRDSPIQFTVKVIAVGPPGVGQLLVLAPQFGGNLSLFAKEVEAVIKAFDNTWPMPRQIIRSDATVQDLFESNTSHAFQELWEVRLKQQPASLAPLGRPVLGGGLRLVMPPQPQDTGPTQIEIKIESFLTDSRKFFIETSFVWPQPLPLGTTLDPTSRLNQVNQFIEGNVIPFARGEQS